MGPDTSTEPTTSRHADDREAAPERRAPTSDPDEHRDQAIAVRRAAQLDWRTASGLVEQAVKALAAAVGVRAARDVAKSRTQLDEARRGERRTRSVYGRVARETGIEIDRRPDRA
jgi:hypothetical protein